MNCSHPKSAGTQGDRTNVIAKIAFQNLQQLATVEVLKLDFASGGAELKFANRNSQRRIRGAVCLPNAWEALLL